MSLPLNTTHLVYYDKKWTSPEVWKLATERISSIKNVEAYLIFFDIRAKSPMYYPLLKCFVYDAGIDGDVLQILLKVTGYFRYDESQLPDFKQQLVDAYGEARIPPAEKGYLHFFEDNKILEGFEPTDEDEAWNRLVEILTMKTNSENFRDAVFFKLKVSTERDQFLEQVDAPDGPHYKVSSQSRFRIHRHYYGPHCETLDKSEQDNLSLEFDLGRFFYTEDQLPVVILGSRLRPGMVNIEVEDTKRDDIVANIRIKEVQTKISYPKPTLRFKVYRSGWRKTIEYLFIIGLILLATPSLIDIIPITDAEVMRALASLGILGGILSALAKFKS